MWSLGQWGANSETDLCQVGFLFLAHNCREIEPEAQGRLPYVGDACASRLTYSRSKTNSHRGRLRDADNR